MGCQQTAVMRTQEPHKPTFREKKSKLIDSRLKSTKITDIISENVTVVREQLDKQQIKFAIKCLSQHQFFSTLKDDEIEEISKSMVAVEGNYNEYIFQQGDVGNSFFIIRTGQVHVQIDGVYVRTLIEGKSFGQLALLYRTKRTASIKCKGQRNIFLVVKPASFRESLKKIKAYEFQKNKKMISSVQIFQTLTNKQKQLISQNLKSICFQKDQIVYKEGDPAGAFYIVYSGSVELRVPEKQTLILNQFESFGENAFKENSKRQGTVKALDETVCCFLTREDLDFIFGNNFHSIFYFNMEKWALLRSQHFRKDTYLINKLILKFEVRRATQGQVLVQSLPTGLIISLKGTINGKPPGSLFCQKTYLNRSTPSNPIIKNDAGQYAYISFDTIDKVARQVEQKKNLKIYSKKSLQFIDKENVDIFNLSQFEYLKQLGQGQFGKVYLVKNTGFMSSLYAIKCLSKQAIRKQSMQRCVLQQKRILSKIVFPYIVGFAQAYHDEKNIYFLMQYLKGKQMFDVIRQMPFVNRKVATYFFGCLLLAIEHLHENNIIYRDIKPENSVIDYTGKVFLVDLGTAKILKKQSSYKAYTLIGTPHYMAPETFEGNGYSFEADIWSLGVLLYEFLFSKLPYGEQQTDPYIVMKKIKAEQLSFADSAAVNRQAKQLIQLMLEKNSKVRAIKATFENIKKSPYFSGMDWNDLLHEKVDPPYIPKDLRNQKDHNNTLKLQGKPLGEFLYGKTINSKGWEVELWNEDFDWK